MTRGGPAGPSYLASVDGLRALAASLVILLHLGLAGFGWSGVFVFYVISGFVITRSLLDYPAAPLRANLRRFYVRRVRRILPLYLLIVTIGVAILIAVGRRDLLSQLPWILTGTYNFVRMSGTYEDPRVFGHLWSISVEEQFYLVFPLLFFTSSRRALVAVLVAALFLCPPLRYVAGALALRAGWSVDRAGNVVYQFSIASFDAFAMGALLAVNEGAVRARRWLLPIFGAACAAVLGIYAAVYCDSVSATQCTVRTFVSDGFHMKVIAHGATVLVYLFIDLVAVTLVIACIQRRRLTDMVLGIRPLQFLGQRSYGLYMFHVPLAFVFWGPYRALLAHLAPQWSPSWRQVVATGFAVYVAAIVVIADFSFRHFEARFRYAPTGRPVAPPQVSEVQG